MKTYLHRNVIFTRALVLAGAAMLLLAGPALAASGNWTNNASGFWSTAANWDPNAVPGTAAGDVVNLTANISATRTVTNDIGGGVTLGVLNIGDTDNTSSYTLSDQITNKLTFNNNASGAQLTQTATSKGDTISATLVLADSLTITNTSTNNLTLTGIISGAGKSVTINSTNAGYVMVAPTQTRTVNSSGTTTIVTMANTAGLVPGLTVSGTGIQAGSYIVSVDSPTQITLSGNATNLVSLNASFVGNTYSGGTILAPNTFVRVGQSASATGSALRNSPFGTTTLTLNNGATLANSPGLTLIQNQYNFNGDITIGAPGLTGRFVWQGTNDLGGATRTVYLVRSTTLAALGSGNEAIQFAAPPAGGNGRVQNGNLVLATTNTGANYGYARFNATTDFATNSGLILNDHVITTYGTQTPFSAGANAPAVTVNSGAIFATADGGAASRTMNVYSLAGSGLVTNDASAAGISPLTIGTGTATFSGTISDGVTLGKISITKNGASSTQTFSGANNYSAATIITAGTLLVNGSHTLPASGTGYYLVTNTGTLGGSGTIDLSAANLGVTNATGGKLSPGGSAGSAGTLTFALGTGTLDISGGLNTAGSLLFDIGAIASSDKIVLNSGTLNLGSGLLNWNSFAFNNLGGLQTGTYTLVSTPNVISGSLGGSLTGVIGTYNGTLALSGDSKSITLTLSAPSLPIPTISNVTPSQTIGSGTTSITLTGKVSASGPVYPANGESGTVSATINGTQTFGTFTDGVGDFSINFNPSAIPASATPYTITYSYAGDANLSAAANDTSTALTVTTNIVWTGAVSTNFETGGNWNTASAPASDLTSQLAVFSGTLTAKQPALTATRNVSGLSFSTATGGWILSGTANNVLSLGGSGIASANTSGTNTIAGTLNVATNQTWKAGTGGNLLITGALTNNNDGANYSLTINASGNLGNVILSPAAGNSINLTGSNNISSILQVKTGGMLELGGNGVTAPATTSTNYINNTQLNSSFGTWGINGSGKVQVNSGTWLTGDLGKNGGDRFTGIIEVKGGTLAFAGARYLGEGTINVSGGTMAVTGVGSGLSNGGRFSLGSSYNAITNTANMNVTDGFVDLAQANGGNSIGAAISTLLNQSGGILQNGVTVGGGLNGGTSTTFTIGGNNIASDFSALTLTGGTFISAGAINAAGPAGSPGANNFNFMGGTLAAAAVNMTYLGSSSTATATANQTNSSDNIGTLINYGGALAPGGDGNAGETTITGNYAVSNNAAVLAIDLGGTTRASFFTTNVSGYYDYLLVNGSVVLGGNLKINLTNGFMPSGTDQFNIIACSGTNILGETNIITGTFTNLNAASANGHYLGRVTVANMTGATFAVTINSLTNTVYLSDFQGTSSTASYPTNVTATLTGGGGTLDISWPATHLGWILQAQTNSASVGLNTNWVDNLGTASVTSTNFPVDPANPSVFYRLRHP